MGMILQEYQDQLESGIHHQNLILQTRLNVIHQQRRMGIHLLLHRQDLHPNLTLLGEG